MDESSCRFDPGSGYKESAPPTFSVWWGAFLYTYHRASSLEEPCSTTREVYLIADEGKPLMRERSSFRDGEVDLSKHKDQPFLPRPLISPIL